jgi:hypothetical protein
MIAFQAACSARMVPFRHLKKNKLTPTLWTHQLPQEPLEPFYNRMCAHTVAALLAGLAVSSPGPALAAGIDNPFRAVADFYRTRQQANGGSFFLGPIKLSRQRLESAATALQGSNSASEQAGTENYTTALESLRAASLDCIVFNFEGKQDLTTAASSEQEYKFGDPCKLRLIMKNATTLTKDEKLVAATEAKMHLFIRQLQLLDDRLDRATQGDVEVGGKSIPELLKEAMSTSIEFEDAIKRCLGLEA